MDVKRGSGVLPGKLICMDQGAPSSRLRNTYLCYRSLLYSARAPSLGGRLVLLGESSQALERAAAARIAGAATLLLVEGEREGKAAVREGACDFLVSGLDEALRILKNEIRRRVPVSVCLRGPISAVLCEIVERGVQPDFMDFSEQILVQRGAQIAAWERALGPGEFGVAWSSQAGSVRTVEPLDHLALKALAAPDEERERWLRHAPAALGRALSRWHWLPMRVEECARFVAALPGRPHGGSILVERDGLPIWPPPAS